MVCTIMKNHGRLSYRKTDLINELHNNFMGVGVLFLMLSFNIITLLDWQHQLGVESIALLAFCVSSLLLFVLFHAKKIRIKLKLGLMKLQRVFNRQVRLWRVSICLIVGVMILGALWS